MKKIILFVLVVMMSMGAMADRYILALEMKQSRFSLSIKKHLKDAMNKVTFQIPVDKEYYDSVKVGSKLTNKFRTGSAILFGSFGNWKVTVKDKKIIKETEKK